MFQMKSDFAFGLYDLDYDVFGWLNEGHIHRLPVLENIGIKSTVCGPESFTPDHKAIMGGFFNGVDEYLNLSLGSIIFFLWN